MLVGEIEKNAREKIRVSIEEFKKHKFIDCRVYFKDSTGEAKPTKKGITFSEETIDEVLALLNNAREKLLEE